MSQQLLQAPVKVEFNRLSIFNEVVPEAFPCPKILSSISVLLESLLSLAGDNNSILSAQSIMQNCFIKFDLDVGIL
jgi:hypothetical protein